MDQLVFNKNHIYFDKTAKTQEEAFHVISKVAYEEGYVQDENEYFLGLCEREKEATTGFQDGIAIPHSKNKTCLKPGIFLVKFENAIEWNSLDGQPVHVALGLTIPEEGGQNHLCILSQLARKMIDDDFRLALKNSTDVDELFKTVDSVEI